LFGSILEVIAGGKFFEIRIKCGRIEFAEIQRGRFMATSMAEPIIPGVQGLTKPASTGQVPGFLRHPVSLSLVSAALLWLSFPPAEWHGSAWFALVPLFLMVGDAQPRRSIYLAAWLGGFAFWLLAVQWLLVIDKTAWLGWLVMALALSSWWIGFVWATRVVTRRLLWPITVAAPVLWVALEYVRAYAVTGFPWYYLAHSQYRQIYWTQIADFSGSLGLSFLIALVNATIAELLAPRFYGFDPALNPIPKIGWRRLATSRRVRLGLVVVGALATLGYGSFRIQTAKFRPGPRVAMLQSGEVQEYNSDLTKSPQALYELYLNMVLRAADHQPRPDLIVWPETSYPFGHVVIDPELEARKFEEQVKSLNPDGIAADWTLKRDRNADEFKRVMGRIRIPMMIGASTYEFLSSGHSRYNSAILFQPGLDTQSYHKMHLVPFGEYVPLIDVFPWLTALTPYQGTRTKFLDFGDRPSWFEMGEYRLASAICFEDTLPHVVRRFFAEAPGGKQPDLLVNLSNDGWFHDTSEHEMHLAVATFRCVENRVPMARAVNTGVSAMIDGNGRIVDSRPKTSVDVLDAVTPLDDRTSFYSRWGDWLGQAALAATVGFLLLSWIKPNRPRPSDDPGRGTLPTGSSSPRLET